jgi:hypothetical protein
MARTKGAAGKEKLPEQLAMPETQRVELIADLILQIILEEEAKA